MSNDTRALLKRWDALEVRFSGVAIPSSTWRLALWSLVRIEAALDAAASFNDRLIAAAYDHLVDVERGQPWDR